MCYQALDPTPSRGPDDVFTHNQFGDDEFPLFGSRELCVPTARTPGPGCGDGVLEGGEGCDPPGALTCPGMSPGSFDACAENCQCGVQPHWAKDTVDNGDDPEHPGCHDLYADALCTMLLTPNITGDECLGPLDLREWTNQACHPQGSDRKDYNCYSYCAKKGKKSGGCVVDLGVCGGNDSAHCECK